MDELIKAMISFEGYKVIKIDYKINQDFSETTEPVSNDVDFNIKFAVNSEESKAVVELAAIVNNNYQQNNKPLYLNVVIIGIYSFQSSLEDDKLKTLLETNAVAILFPYLRAIISQITVNCGIPPILLPTLNIVEFLKKKSKKNPV